MTLITDTHYRVNSHNSPPVDMTLITDTHYHHSDPTNFKTATLRKNRWLQSSNCELFIHIHLCQHSSSNCIRNIYISLAWSDILGLVVTVIISLMRSFLLTRKLLDHFESVMDTAMTWSTAMQYLF